VKLGQVISGEAMDDQFGKSISLSKDGMLLAVGAPSNGSGYAQIFSIEC